MVPTCNASKEKMRTKVQRLTEIIGRTSGQAGAILRKSSWPRAAILDDWYEIVRQTGFLLVM